MDHDLPAYLRHPTIHGETIVFVADDDLWTVGAAGGVARRLTAGLSEPSTPCLSPDGKLLAFVVQERLGHSTVVLTADRYSHLFPRGDDGAELATAEKLLLA